MLQTASSTCLSELSEEHCRDYAALRHARFSVYSADPANEESGCLSWSGGAIIEFMRSAQQLAARRTNFETQPGGMAPQ